MTGYDNTYPLHMKAHRRKIWRNNVKIVVHLLFFNFQKYELNFG